MPLALIVSLLVFGAVVLTGIVGYLLDESAETEVSELPAGDFREIDIEVTEHIKVTKRP